MVDSNLDLMSLIYFMPLMRLAVNKRTVNSVFGSIFAEKKLHGKKRISFSVGRLKMKTNQREYSTV